jgi:hypothetical protein
MRAKLFFLSIALVFGGLFFAGCGTSAGEPNDPSVYDDKPADTAAVAALPPAVPGEIRLTPFPSSPEYQDVKLSFDYQEGKFIIRPYGGGYQLGAQTPDAPQKMCANSKEGQHAHIIIDNGPYDAVYKSGFEKDVPDGEHYVLCFLSRSYHESIKAKGAYMAYKAMVKNKGFYNSPLIEEPMLFYSRPKGKYVGKSETDRVMLDFYLLNTELGPSGSKVKVEVNGTKEFVVDAWTPYFIEGLPIGKNKVKITLIDKDGKPINCPLNGTEREFELLGDPAPGQ